jgi:hypothetical protein
MSAKTPVFTSAVILLATVFSAGAWAQRPNQQGPGTGGRQHSRSQGGSPSQQQMGAVAPHGANSSAIPKGAAGGVGINPLPFAQQFPGALGNTVGGFPPGTIFPGYGNINQPGLIPGSPTVMPNINNPGGAPLPFGNAPLAGPNQRPSRNFHSGRGHNGGAVYGVPYAVPYAVPYYYVYPYSSEPSVPPAMTEPPRPPDNGPRGYEFWPDPNAPQSSQQTAPAPQTTEIQPQARIPESAAPGKRVTLLAFKDQTLVAVTDYWLSGDTLYYLRNGAASGTPLSQLDLTLTQQLNRERNVPFVLEARP